jgi:hypothetical protein
LTRIVVVGVEMEGEEISQSVICAIFQFGECSRGNKFDRSVQCFRGFNIWSRRHICWCLKPRFELVLSVGG